MSGRRNTITVTVLVCYGLSSARNCCVLSVLFSCDCEEQLTQKVNEMFLLLFLIM